ncbi:MAG: hypothetical protein M1475_03900, partial [Actinobacteria bacterium]|nr:hypothetical protein [Actinomycetota bacterium]
MDEEKKIEEPEKAAAVPPKRLGLKIGAPIAGFFVATTGVGIGLGESKKLPDVLQQPYNNFKVAVGLKNRFIPGKNGETIVDITETSKPVETTQTPTTVEQTTTTQEATTTTEAEIINAPEIAGLKFDQETKSYLNEKG